MSSAILHGPSSVLQLVSTGAGKEFLGMVLCPNGKLSCVKTGMEFPNSAPPAGKPSCQESCYHGKPRAKQAECKIFVKIITPKDRVMI